MNMRILIYMNPLIVDKISKKFLWEKDSGFLYTKQLIESLPIDWRFTILTPKGFDREFFDDKHEIECIEYDYSTSIHQNRYHFNRNILAKALPYGVDIDVVLNMQPEVTANLRVFFENQRREKPIIVNYFHWIDCKESRNSGERFIYRQAEGYNDADLNLFHNEYAKSLFINSCIDDLIQLKHKKIGYFHPLPTTYGMEDISLPDKFILFNHRLNNTTGWKQIVKIFKKLNYPDVKLWLTDESNLKEKEFLEHDNIIVKSIPYESYGYLLRNAHFSICNLQEYATWNMAVLDSINHGTPVLSNESKLMEYLGCIPNNDMEKAISEGLIYPKKDVIPTIIQDYPLKEYIINELKLRVKDKHPKKYEDVLELLPCEKRVFVNTLWSFHANSNFQIIRWKLLTTGIVDDITKKLTSYIK